MRVTCLQVRPRGAEPAVERRHRAVEQLHAALPADLYVLPELWPVGYFEFERYESEAETLRGPTVSMAAEAARALGAHVHLGSFVEHDGRGRLANTSVVLDPSGSILATYRKVHVFGYGSREAELVTPGDTLVTVVIGELTVGLATCYDLRFPEVFRQLVDNGAHAFVIPACWPSARVAHWELLLRARAVENLAVSIGCNAIGTSGGTELGGASQIVGPWGDVMTHAGVGERAITATVDSQIIHEARATFPALDDRTRVSPQIGVTA